MLKLFFSQIAESLSKTIKNDREKIGEFIGKWGEMLSGKLFNFKALGKVLSDIDIEELKNRLSDIIDESGQRIVILIDDIDRLEKTEIQTLFRLVKLTANFKKSTYILAFDDKMVAAAINDRFGGGKDNSGSRFLEKIIQLPLNLPKVPKQDMYDFATSILNETLELHKILLEKNEERRFVENFNGAIISRLQTPRLVVRYNNTISFFIPLLLGEVNIVDLMLIEGIKIAYPDYYEFIKTNSNYFLETYFHPYIGQKDEEKIKHLKNELEKRRGNLTEKEFNDFIDLLKSLFPYLNQAFGYTATPDESRLAKEKRISSSEYFDRYLSYSILKGQLSDIAFNTFISSASTNDETSILSTIGSFITKSSDIKFIHKLREKELEINWPTASNISKVLLHNSHLFSKSGNTIFTTGIGSAYWQMIAFVRISLTKLADNNAAFDFIRRQINEISSPVTAWDTFFSLYTSQDKKNTFTEDQLTDLINILITRFRTDVEEFPFVDNNQINIRILVQIWLKINRKDAKSYFENILSSDESKWYSFLNIFTEDATDSTYLGNYKGDFTQQAFEFIASTFDISQIKACILQEFTQQQVITDDVKWNELNGPYQSRLNIAKQFFYWDKH